MKPVLAFTSRSAVLSLAGALLLSSAAAAEITASTAPYGVMTESIGREAAGLTFPLIESDRYVGLVAGNTGDQLTLSDASGDPRRAVTESAPAYVEILSGPFEGERLDVVAATASGITVALGATSASTLGELPANALAGARLALRPHVTLARLQEMISPALQGSNSSGRADAVQVFANGRFVRYHLAGNGESWKRSDSPKDFRGLVIPPDTSILIDTRTGGRSWLHTGLVRTNAFRKNLVAGEQAFATGFPVDLSPVEAGAFVDSEAPAGTRWRGSLLFPFADWFEQYGVGVPLLNRYFLQPNGTSWRRVLDLRDVAHAPILGATDMFVLRRHNPDPAYVIPVPF